MKSWVKRAGRALAVMLPLALGACQSFLKTAGVSSSDEEGYAPLPAMAEPGVTATPTMHALACDLDHLEKHIDWFGSVTAKIPDVWGQARLTQYRDEFETAMASEINNFSFVISGSQSRSDQAFFASATALSFAAQPAPPVIGQVNSTKTSAPTLVPTGRTVLTAASAPNVKTITDTTLAPAPTPPKATPPTPVQPLTLDDPSSLVSSTDTVINRSNTPKLFTPGFGSATIGLEPSEYLAQKQRYLNLLNQIRRENEGDDTADSPGYSLNLMRIPVSVLPGKRTEIGFAAEITMSLNPILGEDLLPMTFRNLLVNDLSNQFGLPLAQIFSDKESKALLTSDFRTFTQVLTEAEDRYVAATPNEKLGTSNVSTYLNQLPESTTEVVQKFVEKSTVLKNLYFALKNGAQKAVTAPDGDNKSASAPAKTDTTLKAELAQYTSALTKQFKIPSFSFANGLDNRTAVPTSQIMDIYGSAYVFEIAYGAYQSSSGAIDRQKYVHLPDLQAYLKEETRAAYEFLRKNPQLMVSYCTPDLATAIRSRRLEYVATVRRAYRSYVAKLTNSTTGDKEPIHLETTAALAWCLIVDAALLNDRLILDMKQTASAKGKPLSGCDHWCLYFLPEPPPECRHAFNEYVKLRWPIHVFALDPYNQEQNIQDSLSTRRETQLALSIAFTNGMIDAKNLTKYTRRLEAEYETIALNRTHIGFSHGENVFGWRFYPRFQTPDTPSNFEVLFREQLIGGPNQNQLLRQRRLEPGIRECVAIVMMPSFVPYVKFDTESNWFPITNPKHKVLDTAQALRMSRTVQAIKTDGCDLKDACKYRPGELERLHNRAEQLDARLPTQTLSTPVPILNTLGGFEMFSNGTSDLAPELFGWYGAPGIDPTADTTTLFLVGDHFSPLRTHVIVGNEAVANSATATNQVLLSRQVMQVTFQKGAYTVPTPAGGEVRIHVATPYGVTRELAVPMVSQKPAPKTGISVSGAKLTIQYALKPAAQQQQPAGGQTPAAPAAAGQGTQAKAQYVAVGVDSKLAFKWVFQDPTAVTATNFRVKLVFSVPGTGTMPATTITVPCMCPADATATLTAGTDPLTPSNGGDLTISQDQLKRIAADLLQQDAIQQLAQSGALANGLTTSKILVSTVGSDGQTNREILTNDQLSVVFQPVGYCKAGELTPDTCTPTPAPKINPTTMSVSYSVIPNDPNKPTTFTYGGKVGVDIAKLDFSGVDLSTATDKTIYTAELTFEYNCTNYTVTVPLTLDSKTKVLSIPATQLSQTADLLIKTIWTKPLALANIPFLNPFKTKKIVITLSEPAAPANAPAAPDAKGGAAPAPVMVTPNPRSQTVTNELTIKFIGLFPPSTTIGPAPIPMPCGPVEAPIGPIPPPTGPIPPPGGPIPPPGGPIPLSQTSTVPPSGTGMLQMPRTLDTITSPNPIPIPTAPIPLTAYPKP
jgi:hypothetical protein